MVLLGWLAIVMDGYCEAVPLLTGKKTLARPAAAGCRRPIVTEIMVCVLQEIYNKNRVVYFAKN